MKKILIIGIIVSGIIACNNNQSGNNTNGANNSGQNQQTGNTGNPSYDPNRGEGKFTKVDVSPKLDVAMATSGEKVYSVKCAACHKLTDERLVGPGWKGVTSRHTAEWIMNFTTNTDEMLSKDPKAQAMLEICLVRMPNQNLTDQDARDVYEFMRQNDGVK
ncbi:MAG: cytochrome c [Chitinophagaceae bacterium]|jgi:cytochrome c2|nr:cytochrome c [Chitinophagaceae bacterium]OQY93321.1 MAG: cytochrome C [Sphingobacteriales bacterium UTBCD1]